MRRSLGIASRAKRFFLPSPAKAKPLTWDNPVGRFDLENPVLAHDDEEIFFDPKACLDSDCEDFFSVNGDFTPTRVSTPDRQIHTPSHPASSDGSPFLDKYADSSSQKSLTTTMTTTIPSRKKLGDLLLETSQGKPVADLPNVTGEKVDQSPEILSSAPNYSADSTSICRGGVAPDRDRSRERKGRGWKAGHCCLPRMQGFGFGFGFGFDEKRQKMSPGAYRGGGS